MVVGDWPNSGKSSGSGERLMRAKVREKINKIRIYTATITAHICIVTSTAVNAPHYPFGQ